jgi:hypothetical protein
LPILLHWFNASGDRGILALNKYYRLLGDLEKTLGGNEMCKEMAVKKEKSESR